MRIKNYFFTCILFALTISFANAQSKSKKDSLDAMVYNPNMIKSSFSTNFFDSTKNAFKMNPLLIARGVIPVYFERQIIPHFSLQAGVGFTFTDFVYEFMNQNTETNTPNGLNIKGRLGYSVEGALRYYIKKNISSINGYYFSPYVYYRTYNKGVEVEDANSNPTGIFYNDSRDVMAYQILFGNQNVGSNLLFFDWYIGFGFTHSIFNKVSYAIATSNYGTINVTEITPSQKWDKTFSLGVNIGLGF